MIVLKQLSKLRGMLIPKLGLKILVLYFWKHVCSFDDVVGKDFQRKFEWNLLSSNNINFYRATIFLTTSDGHKNEVINFWVVCTSTQKPCINFIPGSTLPLRLCRKICIICAGKIEEISCLMWKHFILYSFENIF